MNIFFLSIYIKRCARYHFDKHMKMILELCQLLCTAWHMLDENEANKLCNPDHGDPLIYKKTHFNHPCAIWVRAHINNYKYIVRLGLELCNEWRFRYNHPLTKTHGCEKILLFLKSNIPPSIPAYAISKTKHNPLQFTLPMPQAMPDECKYKPHVKSVWCCVIAYRRYYMSIHKEKLRSWTRKDPETKKKIALEAIDWWTV